MTSSKNPPQLGASDPGRQPPPEPSSSSSSTPSPTPDVVSFMDRLRFSVTDLLSLDNSDVLKLVDLLEPDPVGKIVLKTHIFSFCKAMTPSEPPSVPPSPPPIPPVNTTPDVPVSISSETSMFGKVSFPHKNEPLRDTNRWKSVLGRLYQGNSDSVPISSLCQKLISVGVRESLSNIEFYRFVLANFDIDINVEIVNYLEQQNSVEDTNAVSRLSLLYQFLKSRFRITDCPTILQSRLERLHQGNRSVAEFADDFSRKLEDLKMAQNEHPLTESYVLSTFKNCLSTRYRVFADDQVCAEKLDDLIRSLMVWEINVESREGAPPYSLPSKPVIKTKATVSQAVGRCSHCNRGFHLESEIDSDFRI